MKKIFLTFVFFLTSSLTVFAQHPTSGWRYSYTAETADKKYLFVMRDSGRSDYFVGDKYEKSGMYLNDGSTTPLWTVDWKQRVYLPSDGKHIVRLGSSDYSATYSEEAFTFLSDGNILKTYETKDLIAFPWLLPHSSAGYGINYSPLVLGLPNDGVLLKVDNGEGYPLNSGAFFDNEKRTMLIETFHGDKYLFDLNTGNIISSQQPSRNAAFILFGFLFIGYSAYLFLAVRAKLSESVIRIMNGIGGFLLTLFLFLIPIISIMPFKISYGEYDPDYPSFLVCCYLSISMLPEYLLTSLNIIARTQTGMPSTDYETTLSWLVLFWLPSFATLSFFTHFLIRFIKSKQRKLL